jgi:hypothetical protein
MYTYIYIYIHHLQDTQCFHGDIYIYIYAYINIYFNIPIYVYIYIYIYIDIYIYIHIQSVERIFEVAAATIHHHEGEGGKHGDVTV